jgi:hypothetical protein
VMETAPWGGPTKSPETPPAREGADAHV